MIEERCRANREEQAKIIKNLLLLIWIGVLDKLKKQLGRE